MYSKIVLAIPHATRVITTAWSDPEKIQQDADRWTDWDTDVMFFVEHPRIEVVIGSISRFDCDLERLMDDPLETEGRGILYTRSHSGAVRELDPKTRERLTAEWFAYRAKLSQAIAESTLLIDCHSFPSDIARDIDICIGVNDDARRPEEETIAMVVDHFTSLGYRTRVNEPYSNSITPESSISYHSLMIELNKQLYWNEVALRRIDRAADVCEDLKLLYERLL